MALWNRTQERARNRWISLCHIRRHLGIAAFLLVTAIYGAKSDAQVVAGTGDDITLSSPVTVTGAAAVNAMALQASGGGTITGNNVTVSLASTDTTDTVYGAFAADAGTTITLNGGSVQVSDGNSSGGLHADVGATIDGTDLTVTARVTTGGTETYVVNANGGTINLTGGRVQGGGADNGSGAVNYGLYVDNDGTILTSGVAVTMTGGTTVTGVQAFWGTITMTGGSVQATGTSTAYGLNSSNAFTNGTTITGKDGVLISASADTAFGAYSAFGGAIDLTGGSVQATGMTAAYGLYAQAGAMATETDVAVTASSSGGFAYGAYATGAGTTLQLNGGSVAATGASAEGLHADSGGAITGTNVTVTSSGTGAEIDGGSTLNLTGGSLTASGGNAISTTGGTNTITITGGTLSSPFADLISANGAVSNLTLNGVTTGASAGFNLLSVVNTSTVTFTADQGSKLTGDIVADATSTATINVVNGSTLTGNINAANTTGISTINLLNGSTLTGAINGPEATVTIDPSIWNVTGDSSVATLNNSGEINFNPVAPFKTVTVTGAYTGGGSITFNTYLNDGSVQFTDKLVVGSTSGVTTVYVRNVGGPGGITGTAPTGGIQLVQVTGGAAASNGTFVLGHRVAAGLFDYGLVKADAQNLYLQSDAPLDVGGHPIINPGTVSPEIPNLASLNTLGLLTSQAQLDTLQFRLGEFHRRDLDADTVKSSELWSRGYYHEDNLHTGDFGAAQVDIGGTQVGGDLHFKDILARGDRLYLGGFAEYANAEGTPYAGKTTLDSYGAGLYATYYHQGWYVDAIFKGDYNDYHAEVQDDSQMSTSGYGLAGSLEGGHQFDLGHGWAVEPQAQMTYQFEEIDRMNDGFGRSYAFNNPQTLDGRLGVKVEKNFLFPDGRRITPYLRSSVIQDMLGDNRLTVETTTVDTPYGGTSAMFDGGITASLTKTVDLYASGIVVAGTKQDSTGVSGGLRFAW